MRPYGVDRDDRGCCPGHDKYPPDHYNSSRSVRARARDKRQSHHRERTRVRDQLRVEDLTADSLAECENGKEPVFVEASVER